MSGNKPDGFTLVELCIGLALWLVISASLASVFRAGVASWKRAQASASVRQEGRAVLDQIAREFRNAVDVPGVDWIAEGERVTFASLDPQNENIEMIRYELIPMDDSSKGSHSAMALQRQMTPLSPSDDGATTTSTLTHYPRQIVWEYAFASPQGNLVWQREWTPAKRLPCGVRVRLTLFNLKGEPFEWSRSVFSPQNRTLPWAE